MFSENPRGFMVLKKISEIMVFETSTATFIPVWVAQDCSYSDPLSTACGISFSGQLCRMKRSFKPICRVHNFVNHGQLIWMLQMGALIHGFCNTKKNPQCTGGTFCQSLGRKPSFLFLDQPTPTVPLPLISKSCLTCIKICDLDEEFACILHVRQWTVLIYSCHWGP